MDVRFTSISWTETNDFKVVLATCNKFLNEGEASSLLGNIVHIDETPYVVHAVSGPGKVVGSGQTFMLRVGMLN